MNQDKQIQELRDLVGRLQAEVNNLSATVNKNNFSSSQTFNKDCTFSTRLRVPVYSAAPTVSEIGDLIAVGGKLYICTVPNATFELVGTQT